MSAVKVKVKVKTQEATTLAIFLALATESTENRGLLLAQALLQVTAKLAQQANFIGSWENALANSTLLCLTNWILGKKAGLFSHTVLAF